MTVEIGKRNRLKVKNMDAQGVWLEGEVLIPKRQVPADCQPGDTLEVFVYVDIEEQLVATPQPPAAQVGEIALLPIVSKNPTGIYLDWGLPEKLWVPPQEQDKGLKVGDQALFKIFLDEANHLYASAHVDIYLEEEDKGHFEAGQPVSLLIARRSDLGFNAVVDDTHWGMLYANEIFQKIQIGDRITGFIKKVRDDGRIDLSLQKPGYSPSRMDALADNLMETIEARNGFLRLTDKSAPEEIYATLGISKKVFKQVVGRLYKERLITLEETGLRSNQSVR